MIKIRTIFFTSILIVLISCERNNSIEYHGKEYQYGLKQGIRDTSDITLVTHHQLKDYYFTIVNHDNGDSNIYHFNPKKDDLKTENKVFQIDDRKKQITRYEFEQIPPVNGRAFIFFDEENKPLVIVWRNWATYFTYITNREDELIVEALINDTTCFFRCGSNVLF